MYTRTAASKWLKRLSFRSTAFNRTSETPTSINVPIFSSRCNVKSSSRNNSNDYRDGYLNGFPWVLFSGPAAGLLFSPFYDFSCKLLLMNLSSLHHFLEKASISVEL
ncbi:hypothetical protein SDJN02_00309 [Cucurbita argyrosperma subsp. argyrosperma]|nr:hypothetical protein SDJN02_00309 [Cucurbita argyrosperma subsp. argyrosperma]